MMIVSTKRPSLMLMIIEISLMVTAFPSVDADYDFEVVKEPAAAYFWEYTRVSINDNRTLYFKITAHLATTLEHIQVLHNTTSNIMNACFNMMPNKDSLKCHKDMSKMTSSLDKLTQILGKYSGLDSETPMNPSLLNKLSSVELYYSLIEMTQRDADIDDLKQAFLNAQINGDWTQLESMIMTSSYLTKPSSSSTSSSSSKAFCSSSTIKGPLQNLTPEELEELVLMAVQRGAEGKKLQNAFTSQDFTLLETLISDALGPDVIPDRKQLIRELDEHESKIVASTDSLKKTKEWATSVQDKLEQNKLKASYILKELKEYISAELDRLNDYVKNLVYAVSAAEKGQYPDSALAIDTFREKFRKVREDIMFHRNLEPLPTTKTELKGCKSSIAFEGDSIVIYLHVPVAYPKNIISVFQHVASSMPNENKSISPSSTFLFIDWQQQKYTEMTEKAFNASCNPSHPTETSQQYTCEVIPAFSDMSNAKSCLLSLYNGDVSDIREDCEKEVSSKLVSIAYLEKAKIAIISPKESLLKVDCYYGSKLLKLVGPGSYTMDLPRTCTLRVDEETYEGKGNVYGEGDEPIRHTEVFSYEGGLKRVKRG